MNTTEMTDSWISQEITRIGGEMFVLQNALAKLSKEMKRLKVTRAQRQTSNGKLQVTDHALVRYLERVKGIDTNRLRSSILTPKLCDAASAGASAIQLDGMIYCIKGNQLVTVKPKGHDGHQ